MSEKGGRESVSAHELLIDHLEVYENFGVAHEAAQKFAEALEATNRINASLGDSKRLTTLTGFGGLTRVYTYESNGEVGGFRPATEINTRGHIHTFIGDRLVALEDKLLVVDTLLGVGVEVCRKLRVEEVAEISDFSRQSYEGLLLLTEQNESIISKRFYGN